MCPSEIQFICQPPIIESSYSLLQNAIPLAAVIISLFALIVSFGSLWIQRIHHRKSVRPVGHVQLIDSLQRLQIEIVNKGCGPMLIKKFTAVRQNQVNHI